MGAGFDAMGKRTAAAGRSLRELAQAKLDQPVRESPRRTRTNRPRAERFEERFQERADRLDLVSNR